MVKKVTLVGFRATDRPTGSTLGCLNFFSSKRNKILITMQKDRQLQIYK